MTQPVGQYEEAISRYLNGISPAISVITFPVAPTVTFSITPGASGTTNPLRSITFSLVETEPLVLASDKDIDCCVTDSFTTFCVVVSRGGEDEVNGASFVVIGLLLLIDRKPTSDIVKFE